MPVPDALPEQAGSLHLHFRRLQFWPTRKQQYCVGQFGPCDALWDTNTWDKEPNLWQGAWKALGCNSFSKQFPLLKAKGQRYNANSSYCFACVLWRPARLSNASTMLLALRTLSFSACKNLGIWDISEPIMPSAWKCPQERNGDSTAALIEAKLVTVKSHFFTHTYSLQLDEVLQFWPSRLKVDSPSPSTERFAESLELQRYGDDNLVLFLAGTRQKQAGSYLCFGRQGRFSGRVFEWQDDGTEHIKSHFTWSPLLDLWLSDCCWGLPDAILFPPLQRCLRHRQPLVRSLKGVGLQQFFWTVSASKSKGAALPCKQFSALPVFCGGRPACQPLQQGSRRMTLRTLSFSAWHIGTRFYSFCGFWTIAASKILSPTKSSKILWLYGFCWCTISTRRKMTMQRVTCQEPIGLGALFAECLGQQKFANLFWVVLFCMSVATMEGVCCSGWGSIQLSQIEARNFKLFGCSRAMRRAGHMSWKVFDGGPEGYLSPFGRCCCCCCHVRPCWVRPKSSELVH